MSIRHHSRNRFGRRQRSGLGTVIGTLLFIIIALASISLISALIARSQAFGTELASYENTIFQRNSEDYSVSVAVYCAGVFVGTCFASYYNITVTNNGGTSIVWQDLIVLNDANAPPSDVCFAGVDHLVPPGGSYTVGLVSTNCSSIDTSNTLAAPGYTFYATTPEGVSENYHLKSFTCPPSVGSPCT